MKILKKLRNCYIYFLIYTGLLFRRGKKGVMLIDKGDYEYKFFNCDFMRCMLSAAIAALYNGYKPHISLHGREEGYTNWDTFFQQPYLTTEKPVATFQSDYLVSYTWATPYTRFKQKCWSKVYQHLVRLNPQTQQYVDEEWATLFPASKRILGVIVRGTDYKYVQIPHPLQPDLNMVIKDAHRLVDKYKLDYIYLATDEQDIFNEFASAFPKGQARLL